MRFCYIITLLLLSACASERLVLKPAEYKDLGGWERGITETALRAFERSCEKLTTENAAKETRIADYVVTKRSWKEVCNAAKSLPHKNTKTAQAFFAKYFQPFRAKNGWSGNARFTGYHSLVLKGSKTPGGNFNTPLYKLPAEAKRRFERVEIQKGVLANQNLELVWVEDPIEAFFLHIQGSGTVEFPDGSRMRVGYAGQNGHPYFPIGAFLRNTGELPKDKVSAQTIKAWLRAHPERAAEVMAKNPSYVYFRELATEAPIGAQGVELTEKASLAVDRKFIPLGLPIWVSTQLSSTEKRPEERFQTLLIAQDTGGAIKGPIRADIYLGEGEEAEDRAGFLHARGEMFVLLPKAAEKADGQKISAR